jgi:hypothetical protein
MRSRLSVDVPKLQSDLDRCAPRNRKLHHLVSCSRDVQLFYDDSEPFGLRCSMRPSLASAFACCFMERYVGQLIALVFTMPNATHTFTFRNSSRSILRDECQRGHGAAVAVAPSSVPFVYLALAFSLSMAFDERHHAVCRSRTSAAERYAVCRA